MVSDLGYFENCGHYIISFCLILYGMGLSFLLQEYGDI
jgi:hypothetical protein